MIGRTLPGQPRWLALLVVPALLLLATPAWAANIDSLGGDVTTGYATNMCRGAKIRATKDSTLLGASAWVRNSVSHEINYYVYEAGAENATYTRIEEASATKIGTVTSDWGWEDSPPMYAELQEGMWYSVLYCWVSSTSIQYAWEAGVPARQIPVGVAWSGARTTSGTPPPTTAIM